MTTPQLEAEPAAEPTPAPVVAIVIAVDEDPLDRVRDGANGVEVDHVGLSMSGAAGALLNRLSEDLEPSGPSGAGPEPMPPADPAVQVTVHEQQHRLGCPTAADGSRPQAAAHVSWRPR